MTEGNAFFESTKICCIWLRTDHSPGTDQGELYTLNLDKLEL